MRINIFGLGYVGCVSAVCLANDGNEVTGIDIDETKVTSTNKGKSPIIEPDLDEAFRTAVASGKLKATINEIGAADVTIVCVGTPSNENGSINLEYLRNVSEQIGDYLGKLDGYHVVSIRSTVLPGTIEKIVIPIIEKHSGKLVGQDFGVCMNPEFLREGSSIHDYHDPPFTLIGEFDTRSGDVLAHLYRHIDAPLIRKNIKVAEMLKYTCNSFHALKIAFANEIGNICKRLDIDSHDVMDIFCKDTKLNLSKSYLKPGFAFGGSCLPKDIRALLYKAKQLDVELPLLGAVLNSNNKQIDLTYNLIRKKGVKNVGILGLSFKAGTDDLRESPMVELAEKLIGKGYSLSIYDKDVSMARIFGSNKRYIESVIPHIASLMKDSLEEIIDSSEIIVIGNKTNEHGMISSKLAKKKCYVLDLVKFFVSPKELDGYYEGVCW